jgi:hypothetical protein
MDDIALILLRAFQRSAGLFLKEGVAPAIRVLEERQQPAAPTPWLGDGRLARPTVGQTQHEFAGGPAPR